MKFNEFKLKEEVLKAISDLGFKEPSPIQKEAIPFVLNGNDIVAQAQTGTGKTAAFGLPMISKMDLQSGVEGLVIVPTRELAIQVSDELFKFGKYLGLKTATVYGGSSYDRQIKHINNSQIVVATPGRLLDLLSSKQISINPKFLVLDEADEMLDMGFLDDIKKIISLVGNNSQKLLFSATMPKPILILSKEFLTDAKIIKVTADNITNEKIKQFFYVVEEYERDDALIRLFDYYNPKKAIVFCKMKKDVDRLSTFLISQGFVAKGLHGDMDQRRREEVIRAFKSNKLEILIATDVAARGLDVSDVDFVFNYQIPHNAEPYAHRIGRTARGGKEGIAISIATPEEFISLKRIQKDLKTTIEAKVIPTKYEVRNQKQSELINKIENQDILDEAIELIQELKQEFDSTTIKYKLASMIISNQKLGGKNKIGKNYKEIKEIFAKIEYSNKNKRNFRGRNRRRR